MQAARQVQSKLNRLSVYVLGLFVAKAERGSLIYQQALLAMATEFDGNRLDDAESFESLKTLTDGAWAGA